MSQSPMIAVPLKRTDEVDWVTPLKRYIALSYQDDPEKYAEECGTIHRLRQDMRGAGNDITGRDVLYRYFGQLEILDLRFPVDEAHIKIGFMWYDAFTQRPTSQFSLAFEKASTIFNIASVLSAIAASQTRVNEPEGVRKAFHFFQAAAGIYTYINENFLHAPSIDLSRDTVKMLVSLMLAQAQEVSWEKAYAEKKKSLLISKLAAQVAWSYNATLEAMADGVSKQIFDKNWQTLCQIKAKMFTAIAQHYRALAAENDSKWGEMVSRIQIAETAIKEAEKQAKSFTSGFTQSSHPTVTLTQEAVSSIHEITKSHLAIISEKKTSAVRDNDMIYHEAVPSEGSLGQLEKLNATKPLPISELYSQSEMQKVIGPDTFQRLIPLSVHESSSLYSEEKAKLVRAEAERCETANQELASALEFMNLPAGLEKFKNRANDGQNATLDALAVPPNPVKELADFIQNEELGESIANLIASLDRIKSGTRDALENANLSLDEERSQCEALRAKYTDLWTQRPSGPLTQVFRTDSKALFESLDKAAVSDQNLYRSFDQIANNVMVLREGRDGAALEQLFARIVVEASKNRKSLVKSNNSLLDVEDSGESEAILKTVSKVEDVIAKLKKLRQERMDTLEDLKIKTQQDDISNLLILNRKSSGIEPQLFAQELEKFRPHQTRVTATIHHQQALMQELTMHYKDLMNGQEARSLQEIWDIAEKKRQSLADQLLKTRGSYTDVKVGYKKGIRFYEDLNAQVQDLVKAVDQFCRARKEERGMLEQQVMTTQSERESKALKDQLSRFESVSSPSTNALPIDALANLNLGGASRAQMPAPMAPMAPMTPMNPHVAAASQWTPTATAPAPASAAYTPMSAQPTAPSFAPQSQQSTPQQAHTMVIPNTGPFALPSPQVSSQPPPLQQPLQRQSSYSIPNPPSQQQQQRPYSLQQQFSQPQLQSPMQQPLVQQSPMQQQQQQPYQTQPSIPSTPQYQPQSQFQQQPQYQQQQQQLQYQQQLPASSSGYQQQQPTPVNSGYRQPMMAQGQYQQPIQHQYQQQQQPIQQNMQLPYQSTSQQFQQPIQQQPFQQQPYLQQQQQSQQSLYQQQQPIQQQLQSPGQFQQPGYNAYSGTSSPSQQYQQQQPMQPLQPVYQQQQPVQPLQPQQPQQQPLQPQQQSYHGGYQQGPVHQQQQQQQFPQGGYAPIQPTTYQNSLLD
ncbi:bck1-like resistance to osmotic shock [Lobosporangium transversale]|uniref:BRO domain-containing protein 1 n=1 Tax=Lobosporangium transversale TaxID=64571 RepID=A0A1Y2GSI4_9FUNG|nr:BRO1-like domain-domain-containing protein [Lobosporangium transversale]KAF9917643.1 bck1-like resistance to osmotic shock [Lobosporangium transversale]ORZ21740.1 BRO1-like domain-domain-containing protein [Lobosporangium transversale]|eukprot:XP_021882991.1 BRO1-like domain-domain-containing protein [Lobosporangium transversale]